MEWYESIGLESNPFKNDVFHSQGEIVERDAELKRLLYLVQSGSLVSIKAANGLGKTTMLKAVIDSFKGLGRVVYIDCVNRNVNVSDLIKNRSRKMIVLLDNMDVVSRVNTERIRYYFDEDLVQSIVFTSTKPLQASKALISRIGANVIKLRMISASASVKLLQQRLNGIPMISENVAKKIFAMSHSVEELLRFAHLVCEHAVQAGKQIVDQQDIDYLCQEIEAIEARKIVTYTTTNQSVNKVGGKVNVVE